MGVTSRQEAEQIHHKKVIEAAQNTTGEVLPRGGDKKSKQAKSMDESSVDSQVQRAKRNGVGIDTQKKLDRLARDFKALHEEVKAGHLSVNRASIQAGFVKEGTILDKIKKLWGKGKCSDQAAKSDQRLRSRCGM